MNKSQLENNKSQLENTRNFLIVLSVINSNRYLILCICYILVKYITHICMYLQCFYELKFSEEDVLFVATFYAGSLNIDVIFYLQVRHVIYLLCQFVNHLEVVRLPIYCPSQQEKDDPKLYASNVRRLMASEVCISKSNITSGVFA